MIGAILGDMVGAPYEFDRGDRTKDFPLFSENSRCTDDTVMTIAVAEALLDTLGQPDGRDRRVRVGKGITYENHPSNGHGPGQPQT